MKIGDFIILLIEIIVFVYTLYRAYGIFMSFIFDNMEDDEEEEGDDDNEDS